jgi:hypothetical protein
MSAPQGNKFWTARSTHGRKPTFSDSDQLWDACCEYFDWVESNPLYEDKLVTFQGAASHEPVAKMRAMTIEGMCIFLDIGTQTWRDYRAKEGFSEVVKKVDDIIRTQKFQGASADLLNANIIARDLGLADKSELSGKDGGPIQTEDLTLLTPEERAVRLAALLDQAKKRADETAG